jgi:RNA ligase
MNKFPKLNEEFQKALDDKHVSCRKHPELDLWILNYTPEVQFGKLWNDVTKQCRGLVVDESGKVIARPFKKFFNLSEHDNPDFEKVPYGMNFKAFTKCDGSLGIIFHYQDKWRVATRGSFESDQAKKAQKILDQRDMSNVVKNLTILCEIIYKENRIVVDYGDLEDLVLLGAIETSTGKERDLSDLESLPFNQVKVFDVSSLEDLPKDTKNFEGYVVKFENGLRVKVKLDEYVRLHKVMTGITPNRLWESLKNGDDIESMIKDLPDEMYDETMQVVEDIRNAAAAIVDLHIAVFSMLELDGLTRKDQANLILQKCRIPFEIENVIRIDLNSGIMFSLLDGKHDVVLKKTWDLVKPESNDLICKSDLLG